ncbi:MAG: ATP-dependent protease [Lachnospiraceae bacterium]|nr:ATP-dependent protease [Lachnospiraceae bacterium]
MKKKYELDYTQLKNNCSPSDFSFQSTAELTPLDGIIGQERAVKAFEFGLAVKMKGYNIYMSGPSGTGKTTYAVNSAQKLAETEPVPRDWCYVYNFENPMKPQAISFEAGIGKHFKDDMAELVVQVQKELSKAFLSEDYQHQKLVIVHGFEDKQDEMFDEMSVLADEYDFMLKSMDSSIYFIPIVNGEPVENESYDVLSEEEKVMIEKKNQTLQEKISPLMREIHKLRKECDKQVEELNHKVGMAAIGHHIEDLLENYKAYDRAVSYINDVRKDILDNLDYFVEEEQSEEEMLSALLPLLGKKQEEDITLRYRVNLIVDHSQTQGAPVMVTFNPTYNNLMGEIEYDSEFGSLTTDFMKIKSGLFHQANGGYLIVQAHDILSVPHAWDALRSVIKTKEIDIDSIREMQGSTAAPVLKPEPIPIEFKVIMIGSTYFYDFLSDCDEEFDKFFKIRADFDYEMPRTNENMLQITRFIKGFVDREKTLEFDVSAICEIIEYSSRSVSNQDKLSTRFNYLAEILVEAYTWAKLENASIITVEHVRKAIYEKEQRMKLYEEKLDEMLDDDVIMIDTQGAKIGQINGLAVLDMGSYTFGTPSRITATTYVGKSGIVNIEKEASMSGHTHDKGVQIITGFLGQTYAQKFPMALSCRVCFEQNYNGIDGDSASSTELYCIISSLSGLPIAQNLAVTGSVNQKGEIQAIGGVTQKIEGFFKLCKKRGLTGEQGVIIPISNVKELVLNDEVVDAVKKGVFHIYPISHIDEGIELLMNYPAGEKDEYGEFPKDSVHGKVYAKLKAFAEASKPGEDGW